MLLGLERLFKFNVSIEEKQPGGPSGLRNQEREAELLVMQSGQTWKREKVKRPPIRRVALVPFPWPTALMMNVTLTVPELFQ